MTKRRRGDPSRNPVLIVANPNRSRRKNPVLIVANPTNPDWPMGAVPIPAAARRTKSFKSAARRMKQRYGIDPVCMIPVRAPKGSARYLSPVGEAESMSYTAADGPGGELITWDHLAGDHGKGVRRTRPPIYAWDTINNLPVVALPPGTRMRFGPRGISG